MKLHGPTPMVPGDSPIHFAGQLRQATGLFFLAFEPIGRPPQSSLKNLRGACLTLARECRIKSNGCHLFLRQPNPSVYKLLLPPFAS